MEVVKVERDDRQGFEVRGARLASRPDVATWTVLFTFSAILGLVDGEEEVHLRRATGKEVSAIRQGLMRSNRATVASLRVDMDLALAARDED